MRAGNHAQHTDKLSHWLTRIQYPGLQRAAWPGSPPSPLLIFGRSKRATLGFTSLRNYHLIEFYRFSIGLSIRNKPLICLR